jgi:UDP-3-O-[3-hydroxymyristoyl] glucosamine N-acyltransferase
MEDKAGGRGGDLLMAKVREIAEWVGAELRGEGDGEIARVSSIGDAAGDTVVFATDAATLKAAMESRAGAVIAASALGEIDGAGKPVLRVKNAKYCFALAAQRLTPMRAPAGMHATAVVHTEEIGEGTSIGPHCVIAPGVKIGRRCQIMPHVTIYPGVTMGDDCVVQAGVVLGSTGFGYARHEGTGEYLIFPQQGVLVIEDNVEIGANTTIDRGALGETRIGCGTKIDNLVHIGHNCVIGKNVVIAAQTGISGSSVVEDGAVLGGQVGIGEHATVGKGVILGGGAGVLSGKKMHGPGEVFWGRPARPLKEYLKDLARLKRRD